MPLEPRPPKIVARKGQKENTLPNVWTKTADHRNWLWQCHRAGYPSICYICSKASELPMD